MKNRFPISFRYQRAAGGLFLGLVFLVCASASAQELLKNGGFESPFPVSDPTAGWAIVFPGGYDGDYADWAIAGQTLAASRVTGGHGAHLRPNNSGTIHAYFKQLVTNLTAGASYTLSIQRMRANFANYIDGDIQRIYMSAVSGSTSNVVFGNTYSNGPYVLRITCGASRQIEVQLHNWKRYMSNEGAEDMKHAKSSAWFDDISLVTSVLTEHPIQSIQESNGVVVITWNSVAGETYRVQYRTDVTAPAWTDLPPPVVATGPTASKTDAVAGTSQRYYRVMLVQ